MTNEEIEKIEQKLSEILKMPFEKQPGELQKLGNEAGVNLPHSSERHVQKQTITMTQAMHSFLQSKMMLNACASAETSSDLAKQACNSAKWSCRWAAIAAIVACISIVVMLCLK